MPVGSFPELPGKAPAAGLFNRRRRTVTVTGSKTYGPEWMPAGNAGVARTASATVTWKLTLTRR